MTPYEQLLNDIETALGRKLQTPKDFNFLRERIFARQHVLISSTTLKRLWGYVDDKAEPRKSTLSILAHFLGYLDWEEYQRNALLPKEQQSSPVMTRRLSVMHTLHIGDRVRLTWQPERVCDIEYLGALKFRVVASEKTRLQEGDTFECSLIVEGEPLYIDNLKQGVTPRADKIAYVCGKKTGVMFEYLMKET